VRDVFPHSAQVLAINDQTSGAGVILESTRIRGILRGNAVGELQVVGILADQRIKAGEKVLTAGGDQIFPRGLPVGEVEKVVRDPDRDAFIDIFIKPAARLDQLDEVLVITSTQSSFSPEQQQDLATSQELKGPEAEAIKEQRKASQIMAERLPGLTDPNAPAANQGGVPATAPATQAGQAPATPAVVPQLPKVLPPQHPDRFTPGSAPVSAPDAIPDSATDAIPDSATDAKPKPKVKATISAPGSAGAKPSPKTQTNTTKPAKPPENP